MPAPGSPLHIKTLDDVTIVSFRDRILLDTHELQIIQNELLDLIMRDKVVRLVVDFDHVKAISSQMLGTLLTANEAIKKAKGRMTLCNLQPKLVEIFEITKLKKVFKAYSTQDKAVAACAT